MYNLKRSHRFRQQLPLNYLQPLTQVDCNNGQYINFKIPINILLVTLGKTRPKIENKPGSLIFTRM